MFVIGNNRKLFTDNYPPPFFIFKLFALCRDLYRITICLRVCKNMGQVIKHFIVH